MKFFVNLRMSHFFFWNHKYRFKKKTFFFWKDGQRIRNVFRRMVKKGLSMGKGHSKNRGKSQSMAGRGDFEKKKLEKM